MGWSTSVISPPDGDMAAYLASLEKLLGRDDARYWPTHGPAIDDPKPYVRAFLEHRAEREAQIARCLDGGLRTIPEIVAVIYADVDPRLHRAAGPSVLAPLIHMAPQAKALPAGAPTVDSD